jgi:cell volume regulation protein A
VIFSVLVQGGLVPWATRLLRLSVHTVTPEPWSVGIRLQAEPDGVQRVVVAPGSFADGTSIGDLENLPEDAWISLIVRGQQLLPATAATRLAAGDSVVVLARPKDHGAVRAIFD